MPSVELTLFGPIAVTAITITSGQAAPSSTGSAEAAPSRRATKPPKSERAADADARRATELSVATGRGRPSACAAPSASAAKPDALDASPDAVGKSLCDSTRSHSLD